MQAACFYKKNFKSYMLLNMIPQKSMLNKVRIYSFLNFM